MSEKFTRGPWTAEMPRWTAPTDERHVYDIHGQLIARIPLAGTLQSINETIANAHLIAAAPEMYEAVETALECLENKGFARSYVEDLLRNALRKARGEA